MKCLPSCTPMTLNEGQGHQDQSQIKECSRINHHTTFEANQFINSECMPTLKLSESVELVKKQLFPLT